MSPRWFLAGSLLFSLSFNISWAWSGPWLSVVAAAACTLIVPAGLHLWPQVPARNGEVRFLRALVMTGICVAAAVTSFAHAVHVLMAAGWDDWTAWSVIGGAELLVALSTMAVRAPVLPAVPSATDGADRTSVTDGPASSAPADPPGGTPVPPDPDRSVPAGETEPDVRTPGADAPRRGSAGSQRTLSAVPDVRPADRLTDLRAWTEELGERPTETAVRRRYGCRQTVAQALLAELDELDRVDPVTAAV